MNTDRVGTESAYMTTVDRLAVLVAATLLLRHRVTSSQRDVGAAPELAMGYGVTESHRDSGSEPAGLHDYLRYNETKPRYRSFQDLLDAARAAQQRDLIGLADSGGHVHCFDLGCERPVDGGACIAADAKDDDGYCGSPEFCDCARYAIQREDADLLKVGGTSDDDDDNCLVGPPATLADLELKQDPLSRGAEPGHPLGATGNNAHWTRTIKLRPVGVAGFEVIYGDNGVLLGDLIREVDGYFTFWPEGHGGYWAAYVMRAIADCMDELNAPWDEQIRNDPRIGGGQPS